MAQHADIALPSLTFTRADFTALRAWVQRIPIDRIAKLYYTDDAPQVHNGLEKHLTAMRHDLIERASVANPHLASALSKARAGGPITTGILDVLVKAADAKPTPPHNPPTFAASGFVQARHEPSHSSIPQRSAT